MSTEQYEEILASLSHERLNSYKQNSEDGTAKILDHYIYNLLANQKLYPALHILEVIFRNKTHISIQNIFNIKDWLLAYAYDQDEGLNLKLKKIGSKSLDEFNKNIFRALKSAKETAFSQKRSVIEGDLISNLTFGFWTSLYMHIFSNILSNKGLFVLTFKNFKFENLGSDLYLKQEQILRGKIDSIRKNRNRIFHYDKINNHKNLEEEIYTMIYYISIDSHDYFKERLNYNEK